MESVFMSSLIWQAPSFGSLNMKGMSTLLHPLILHHVLMSDSEGGELRPLRVV